MRYMSPGEVPTSRSTSVTWNGKLAMSASSPPTMKLPREAARATGRILSNHSMLEGLGRWPSTRTVLLLYTPWHLLYSQTSRRQHVTRKQCGVGGMFTQKNKLLRNSNSPTIW